MPDLIEINRFPLTGARAETLESAQLQAAGLVGDRLLVLYQTDPTTGVNKRVSQKQIPSLATIESIYSDEDYDDFAYGQGSIEISVPDMGWQYSHLQRQAPCLV